ncbi:MAG TPA: tRNA (adenosine(37)-N6)-threonylcarbamoyltransferase complex transferase subunit TsaD [Candidatus Paceibacterota bacterium]|nr:tRNA (adenosine(37)-N6)-threonylcarbamoyltransferase complex transferase subunit TsaD [Candidatus Paceibacterota bacterium]
MKILGIETSCDETAVALVDGKGDFSKTFSPVFRVLGNTVLTQIPLHRKYGGVYPSLAKREHAKNLLPVFIETLKKEKGFEKKNRASAFDSQTEAELQKIFVREPELLEQFLKIIPTLKKPKIDAIAVTYGPGLEPALWVGLNFAKALALVWNLPVIPVNHMEGHAVSALLEEKANKKKERGFKKIIYPAVLLLVSGGHTELILIKAPLRYQLLGATRDDAAGEAFDKTARLLGLPYPGGPEIAKLAETFKNSTLSKKTIQKNRFSLPRPMISSDNLDFSFSGLKTAVLYTLQKIPKKTSTVKAEMASEIENAITETLVSKTRKAMESARAKTLILGGGVTANKTIRAAFQKLAEENHLELLIPSAELTTDNALMIALAGYLRAKASEKNLKKSWSAIKKIKANGSLELLK